jgi:sec-independent protein translocase protein TatC
MKMVFLKYCNEIKNRFFLVSITGFTTLISAYVYKEIFLFLLVQQNFSKKSNSAEELSCNFIFTHVTEVFSTYIKLLTFVTMQILTIYFFYHVFLFLSPAFYRKEYFKIRIVIMLLFIVYVISFVVFTHSILPVTWQFFLSFQPLNLLHLYFEAKLSEYLSFCIFLYYIFNLYCQTIFIFFIVLRSLPLNVKFARKIRKMVYFFLILFSLFISPPDVFVQLLILSFLCITYEIVFVLSLYPPILNKFN